MRAIALVAALFALCGTAAAEGPGPGYRLFEAAAASVNGEVLFLSDVVREACCHRCGIVPGLPTEEITLARAREKLIADTLVLQEQRKLGLGAADNAALDNAVAEAAPRLRACRAPCARDLTPADLRGLFERRALVRDFLEKRVSVFIDVSGEEVQREIERLRSRGGAREGELAEENVRKSLFEGKAAVEIRNWFDRAASKSRLILSPLPEP